MKTQSALISWIGDVDIISYLRTLPRNEQEKITSRLTKNQNSESIKKNLNDNNFNRISPIYTIVKEKKNELGKLFLLTNRIPEILNDKYRKYLSQYAEFTGEINVCDLSSEVENIADLPKVYEATLKIIEEKIRPYCTTLYCNLTSGAGVTSSALVMLTTAFFDDYHICQVYGNKIARSEKLPQNFSELIRKRSLKEPTSSSRILGNSDKIREVRRLAEKVAPFEYSVLLLGPSGTGKSTLARDIHRLSGRKNKKENICIVNCGGLTTTLLESRLFGHRKGAFTDAKEDQSGEFKNADGGTLLLDEIAECSLEMQRILLDVLQPRDATKPTVRHYKALGGNKEETSDVRIIAATNKDLMQLVKEGKFREDLFYRLATIQIAMPSLAERSEDIIPIAESHLKDINTANGNVPGYQPKKLSEEAKNKLLQHSWPGNIRELQNTLQESAIFCERSEIGAEDIILHDYKYTTDESHTPPKPEEFSLKKIMDDIERRYINAAFLLSGDNKAEASRRLGMKTPQNLESRIKALNMELRRNNPPAP